MILNVDFEKVSLFRCVFELTHDPNDERLFLSEKISKYFICEHLESFLLSLEKLRGSRPGQRHGPRRSLKIHFSLPSSLPGAENPYWPCSSALLAYIWTFYRSSKPGLPTKNGKFGGFLPRSRERSGLGGLFFHGGGSQLPGSRYQGSIEPLRSQYGPSLSLGTRMGPRIQLEERPPTRPDPAGSSPLSSSLQEIFHPKKLRCIDQLTVQIILPLSRCLLGLGVACWGRKCCGHGGEPSLRKRTAGESSFCHLL